MILQNCPRFLHCARSCLANARHSLRFLLNFTAGLFVFAQAAFADPDTTTNRYATAADAVFWPTVNEGDYLIFEANASNHGIYAGISQDNITLDVGEKILIWQGDYSRIFIDGANCQGTAQEPTIITNLGGQVRWGNNESTAQYRTFELKGFEHIHLTGKYDPVKQTGDPAYLGHDGGNAFGSGDYYERYGLWGNQRWSGNRYGVNNPNVIRAYDYVTFKADYVATWGGGFAGFNLKTDNPANPERVVVDLQDCFSGFTEGEGFYISWSTGSVFQDFTQLTLRNNIVVFAGTEGFQTDNLSEGSVIENNIIIGSATTFRDPFMDYVQQGTHQLSFVEGGIAFRNNILVGGQGVMQGIRFKDSAPDPEDYPNEPSRVFPDPGKKLIYENNYLGMGRYKLNYMSNGDGITPYEFRDNIYGELAVPHAVDAYFSLEQPLGAIDTNNDASPVLYENNRFNPDIDQFQITRGSGNITSINNIYAETPIIRFNDLGFPDGSDFRRFTRWSATYGTAERLGEFINYKAGDVVIYWDGFGETKMFQCIADHAGNYDPNTSPAQWLHLTWGGRNLPPFDVRLAPDSFYNYRGMGLAYNLANQNPDDLEAPVITLNGGNLSILQGASFVDPGWVASDNVDGDMTDQVVTSWLGAPLDPNVLGEYVLQYELPTPDSAGSLAELKYRIVTVSESNVMMTEEAKVNMHRYGAVNLPDWTDLANDPQGLRNSGASTTTVLYGSDGAATGWTMLIENINGGYSEHYKTHTNSVGRDIGEFPAAVTRRGLRIRNPHENPCVFVLTGLDANSYYDVSYTGYLEGDGPEVLASLADGQAVDTDTIDVRNNSSEMGYLANVVTDANGRLDLVFSTPTSRGISNIGGLILREKTGFGSAGEYPIIASIPDVILGQGTGSGALAVMLSDSDSLAGDLMVWAVSSDSTVIDTSDIVISGTGLNRTMTIQSNGSLGTATITLVASDGYNTSTVSFVVTVSGAAVFSQGFDASSSVSGYVGTGSLTIGEFDDISAESGGGSWSVVSGVLQIIRGTSSGSNNDAGLARVTDDVLGDPDLLHFSVDMALSNVGNVWNELFVIELGNWSGVTDYGSGGSYSSIYQRLEVKGDGAGEFKLRIAGTNSTVYPADGSWGKLDWYINKTASPVNYTDPGGQQQVLGANACDIWLEGQQLFNDVPWGDYGGTMINDFRIRFSSNNSVTVSFDDLVIKDTF